MQIKSTPIFYEIFSAIIDSSDVYLPQAKRFICKLFVIDAGNIIMALKAEN